MRWIVISLLVVNALILGWRWFGASEPETASRSPTLTAPPAIELLPDGAVSPVVPEASVPAVETGIATAAADASATIPESSIDPAAPPVGELPADPANGALTPASNLAADTVAPPGTVSVGAPADALAATDLAVATPPEPTQGAAWCAWTPWRERPATDLGGAEPLQTEQQDQEIGRSYLVYIPAKASREQTLQRLAELKAEGIEAAYLNKGPQAGGISLGLFSKPESMQLRLRELKKAGIADVSGIERIRTEPRIRQLLRWTGEKTPSPVQNQALVSCNDVAPAAAGQ
ncbi:MAG: hypothetical protein ACOY3E_16415 [Pseudomonadota bacterium]